MPGACASLRAVPKTGSGDATERATRASSRANYLSHHLARIVTAAIYHDALHIEEGVNGLKMRAHDLAQADQPATGAD